MEIFREIKACRSCGSSRLIPILSLRNLYISDFVEDKVARRGKAPLELVLCDNCKLLQLRHTVNPELLYREYFYLSSINPVMVKALKDITNKTERLVDLEVGDIVLDIGSNDSTLLRCYETVGLRLVGFEPAKNLMEEATQGNTIIINDFFNYHDFQKRFGDEKAKIITAIAMFYDLDNPNKFLSDVVKCLDKDGVFIIEQRYLPSMLEQNDVGNIVHEHLEFYSLLSLKPLLERHGLEIFDVELTDVNGGSFRTYIQHKGSKFKIHQRVRQLEEHEKSLGLDTKKPCDDFARRVENIKEKVVKFVKQEQAKGKVIHVYGASTKGNTVLQYFGLNNTLIEAAAERDARKWRKKTVGTWIPIIPEEESRHRADYFLVLIWFYKNAILKREEFFLKKGGKLVFPFPEFTVT